MVEPKHVFSTETSYLTRVFGDRDSFPSLHRDSRSVTKDGLFFCMSSADTATAHIGDAVQRGAAGVVLSPDDNIPQLPGSVSVFRSQCPVAQALSYAAASFYPSPSLHYACAVTGTNGKTSVAHIFRHLSAALDTGSLSIGTLGMIPEGAHPPIESIYFGLTSPDPLTLHSHLSHYTEQHGIRTLCLEASSHGLDQYRVDGVCCNSVMFTNITDDHLDYHGTLKAYLAAKRRILDLAIPGGLAIINADMPEYVPLAQEAADKKLRVIGIGYSEHADYHISKRKDTANGGQTFVLNIQHMPPRTMSLSLSGGFQAYNACFALAAAYDAFPYHYDSLCDALSYVPEVPGRMQRVTIPHASDTMLPAVYVDFAHTPDALINAARALKESITGRLIIVFGCGGDRDPSKRPLMGKAAAIYGDRVIITDDNPRTEDPTSIRADILPACPHAEEIFPREQALSAAILDSHADDTILVAGKGHEDYQIIGKEYIPYSDSDTVRKLLHRRLDS